jgi:hypothetical protein
MDIDVNAPAVQSTCETLIAWTLAQGHDVLWCALDGSEAEAVSPHLDDVGDLLLKRAVRVPLQHPELSETWRPYWFPISTAVAEDCWALSHIVALALAEVQAHYLAQGWGRRVAGWFTLEGKVTDAASHWSHWMIQRRPQSASRALLRLHDPAVLWASQSILSTDQQNHLMQFSPNWQVLDPHAELQRLPLHSTKPERPALASTQWLMFDHLASLNRTLQQLIHSEPTLDGAGLRVTLEVGLQALLRAEHHGLHGQDLGAFAEAAMVHHARFDIHPKMSELIHQARRGQPLRGLLAGIDAHEWNVIQQELDRPDWVVGRTSS